MGIGNILETALRFNGASEDTWIALHWIYNDLRAAIPHWVWVDREILEALAAVDARDMVALRRWHAAIVHKFDLERSYLREDLDDYIEASTLETFDEVISPVIEGVLEMRHRWTGRR
jgi:hypothetical protein